MMKNVQIVSRKTARAIGMKRYFTGYECKNGHIEERSTSSSSCLACARQRMSEWLEKQNQEELKAKKRATYYRTKETSIRYREINKEKIKDYCAEWYRKNRDKCLEYRRRYWQENKDWLAGHQKTWWDKNPIKKRSYRNNRLARERGADGFYTHKDIEEKMESQHGQCAGCGSCFSETGYHVDHIFPLSRGGSNWPNNIQLLCPKCNLSKGTKTQEEWEKAKERCVK